jgi:hypothetical protein
MKVVLSFYCNTDNTRKRHVPKKIVPIYLIIHDLKQIIWELINLTDTEFAVLRFRTRFSVKTNTVPDPTYL